MVHQSTLVLSCNGKEIARLHAKIHDDSDRYVDKHSGDGIHVSCFTYNKLNPFSKRTDEIKWRVRVTCSLCSALSEQHHGNTGLSNEDSTLTFHCCGGKGGRKVVAECFFSSVPFKTPATMVIGATTVVAGAAVGVCSFGLAAPIAGAMIGAGISATTDSVVALKSGELDMKQVWIGAGTGATIGAVTGGIGSAGGSIAAKCATTGAKVAVQASTGAIAGTAGKALAEVKSVAIDHDKEWKDYGKARDKNGNFTAGATVASWTIDATAGAVGGAVASGNSSLANKVASSGATKAVTRAVVSSAAATGVNAAVQGANIALGNQEKFDGDRFLTTAISAAAVSVAVDAGKNAKYAAHGGKAVMLNDRANAAKIKSDLTDSNQVSEAKDAAKTLKKAGPETIQKCQQAAQNRTVLKVVKDQIAVELVGADPEKSSLLRQERVDVDKQLGQTKKDMFLPSKPHNAHALSDSLQGKIAVDLPMPPVAAATTTPTTTTTPLPTPSTATPATPVATSVATAASVPVATPVSSSAPPPPPTAATTATAATAGTPAATAAPVRGTERYLFEQGKHGIEAVGKVTSHDYDHPVLGKPHTEYNQQAKHAVASNEICMRVAARAVANEKEK